MYLTVIHPFGDYKRGDQIAHEATMDELINGIDGVPHPNASHVVRTIDRAQEAKEAD